MRKKSGGGEYALINGYTFSNGGKTDKRGFWRCTRTSPRCRAKFLIGQNMKIVIAQLTHDHDPLRYIISKGLIVRI